MSALIFGHSASAPAVQSTLPRGFNLENPANYLRHPRVLNAKAKQLIYGHEHPSPGLCSVVNGIVAVLRTPRDGCEVLIDLYGPEEFFGDFGLLFCEYSERAAALTDTTVMVWSAEQVADATMSEPRLGWALLQMELRHAMELTHRIESLSMDSLTRRLAQALIQFTDRLGTRDQSGHVSAKLPLTHLLLSYYLGVSREIISEKMSQLRRRGFLEYSRGTVTVYHDALVEWLKTGQPEVSNLCERASTV